MAFKIKDYNSDTVIEPKTHLDQDLGDIKMSGGTLAPSTLSSANLPQSDPGADTQEVWEDATNDQLSVNIT